MITVAVEEETSRQAKETNEIKIQIKAKEDEISLFIRRNQELIQRFQNTEHEAKNRLISKKNENLRLREDLSNFEQQYNKLVLQLNGTKKEIDKKKFDKVKLESELNEIQTNNEVYEARYKQEIETSNVEHLEVNKELQNNFDLYQNEHKRLHQQITVEKEKIAELTKQHKIVIANIENNLTSILNQQKIKESVQNVQESGIPNIKHRY